GREGPDDGPGRPRVMTRLRAAVAIVLVATALVRADDKAGQWVLRRHLASGFTSHVYSWVDKVEGRKVHRKLQLLDPDGKTAVTTPEETVIDLDAPRPRGDGKEPKPKTGADAVECRGKRLECTRTETTSDALGLKMTTIVWTSAEVPLDGIVKVVVL